MRREEVDLPSGLQRRFLNAEMMDSEPAADVELEIGHVLFIDIVGYSKLLIDEQRLLVRSLTEAIRGTRQFQEAEAEEKLIRLPSGDGMALVFRGNPERPTKCAVELSEALKSYPNIRVRMGIHSGPVSELEDVNNQTSVAGGGINMAQRIMDCGDAGHILLSARVAEDLEQYGRWQPYLHTLGECEVKHGVRVRIVNLATADVGNTNLPSRFIKRRSIGRFTGNLRGSAKERHHAGRLMVLLLLGLLLIAIAIAWRATFRRPLVTKTSVGEAKAYPPTNGQDTPLPAVQNPAPALPIPAELATPFSDDQNTKLASDESSPMQSPPPRFSPASPWLFNDSVERLLPYDEVKLLSKDKLWRARNEIFARHGLIFSSARGRGLAAELGSSYHGTDSDQNRVFSRLSFIEQRNVQLLQALEVGNVTLARIHDPDGYTNIHSDASIHGRVIDKAEDGEVVQVVEKSADWLLIIRLGRGSKGYVHTSRLTFLP
jgi:class 3 adenylate cyclase